MEAAGWVVEGAEEVVVMVAAADWAAAAAAAETVVAGLAGEGAEEAVAMAACVTRVKATKSVHGSAGPSSKATFMHQRVIIRSWARTVVRRCRC